MQNWKLCELCDDKLHEFSLSHQMYTTCCGVDWGQCVLIWVVGTDHSESLSVLILYSRVSFLIERFYVQYTVTACCFICTCRWRLDALCPIFRNRFIQSDGQAHSMCQSSLSRLYKTDSCLSPDSAPIGPGMWSRVPEGRAKCSSDGSCLLSAKRQTWCSLFSVVQIWLSLINQFCYVSFLDLVASYPKASHASKCTQEKPCDMGWPGYEARIMVV